MPTDMKAYRLKPMIVQARQLLEAGVVDTDYNEKTHHAAGDWLVRDPKGKLAVLDDECFREAFEPVGGPG